MFQLGTILNFEEVSLHMSYSAKIYCQTEKNMWPATWCHLSPVYAGLRINWKLCPQESTPNYHTGNAPSIENILTGKRIMTS